MTRIERVRYEMLLRVRDFGAAHQAHFPESSAASQAFATVARAVAEIEAHATTKVVISREGRKAKAATRKVILERMAAIARTSRGVRLETGDLLNLQMPTRTSDVAVLTAARGFLHEAEAHQAQLVRLGMPPTCLTELRAATDAFAAALGDRRAGRSGVAGAQAGIDAAITTGTDAARTLDIVVSNTLAHDPVAFAAWKRDRRIVEGKGQGQGTGRKTPSSPSTPTEEAPSVESPADTTVAPVTTIEAGTPADTPADPLRRAS